MPAATNADAEVAAVSPGSRASWTACLEEDEFRAGSSADALLRSISQEPTPKEHCTLVQAGVVQVKQLAEPCMLPAESRGAERVAEGDSCTVDGIPNGGASQLMQMAKPLPLSAEVPRAEQDSVQVAGGSFPEVFTLTMTVRQALNSEVLLEVRMRSSDKIRCLDAAIRRHTADTAVALHFIFQSNVLDLQTTLAEAGIAHGDAVFLVWGSLHCLTASGDGTMRLWQLRGGEGAPMLVEAAGPVAAFSLSTCRTRLLTVACDGEGEVWCSATGARICLLDGPAVSGEFSPDGRWIVGASDDDDATVWCAQTGHRRVVLKGHTDDITSASFSPDSCSVVTASSDGRACIWATDTGECAHSLVGHTDALKSAAFSPDGQLVITASMDATARVWSAASGVCMRVLEGHAQTLSSASFSPSMSQIITASFDHTVKVWKAETGECIFTVPALDKATYSPDSCILLIASGSHDLRLFDASSGNLLCTFSGHKEWVRAASFSLNGALVSSASYDGTLRIWSIASGKCLQTLVVHPQTAVFAAEIVN